MALARNSRGSLASDTLDEEEDKKKKKKGSQLKTGGATQGAVSGASTGAMAGGPPGALIGAAVGAGVGAVEANKAEKDAVDNDPNRPKARRLTGLKKNLDERRNRKVNTLATLSQAVFDWAAAVR